MESLQGLQGKQFFNHDDDPFREPLMNFLPEPDEHDELGSFGYHYTLVKNPDGHTNFGWPFFITNESRDGRMPSKNTGNPNFPKGVSILVTTREKRALVPATNENWQQIKAARPQYHDEWSRILGLTDRSISIYFAKVEDTLVERWFYFRLDAATGKMRFWLEHSDAAPEGLRKHHGKAVFSQENELITLEDNTRLLLNWTFYLPNREPLLIPNKDALRSWLDYTLNKWRIMLYNRNHKKHPALHETTAFGGAVKACVLNCKHFEGPMRKLDWRAENPTV